MSAHYQGNQTERHAMRMRELLSKKGLDPLAGTIFRLPGTLVIFVIFGSQIVVGEGLALMMSRPAIPSRLLAGSLLIGTVILLLLCLASLGNDLESAEGKLVATHNVLIDIASGKCRCDPNAIIIEAPEQPELVGKPAEKGYCDVCQALAILKEQCPEAFEPREGRDLVFYNAFHSFVRIGTREKFEAHQAKPQ